MKAKRVLAWIPPALVVLTVASAYALSGMRGSLLMLSPWASPAVHALWEVMDSILSSAQWVIYLFGIIMLIRDARRRRALYGPAVPEVGGPEEYDALDDGTYPPLPEEQWLDRDQTPLRWHIWVRYVSLPLTFLGALASVGLPFTVSFTINFESVTVVVYAALSGALSLAAMIGFAGWRRWGIYCYLSYEFLQILYLILLLLYLGVSATPLILEAIWSVILLCILFTYYRKRMKLFIPPSNGRHKSRTATTSAPSEAAPPQAAEPMQAHKAESAPTRGAKATPIDVAEAAPTRGTKAMPIGVADAAPTRGAKDTPIDVDENAPTRGAKAMPIDVDENAPVDIPGIPAFSAHSGISEAIARYGATPDDPTPAQPAGGEGWNEVHTAEERKDKMV